ncbi:transposase [Acinetobacter sp. B51(2017)]|uniref:transposase n=1 Tax=Acinetobacter sp. B51(2017) TaxID=2060938 RepID=UPI001E58FF46|nr:transposase [Acinetobacter sp. B51(2017)]
MKTPAPTIYRTTNWSSYNQVLTKRGNISIWFDPNTQWYAQVDSNQGRNQTYSAVAIQCCLIINSLFRLSLRMVTGFVQSLMLNRRNKLAKVKMTESMQWQQLMRALIPIKQDSP